MWERRRLTLPRVLDDVFPVDEVVTRSLDATSAHPQIERLLGAVVRV